MANLPIRYIQWGLNAGAYAANVAADTVLYGEHPKITPARRTERIEDDIPIRSTSARDRQDTALAQNSIRFPHAYFQLLPILASMCLKGSVSPVEQTPAEGDYKWTHTPSESGALNLDHGTLELGDGVSGYAIDGMIIPKLKISGTIPQDGGVAAVAIEADYFGKDNTPQAVTGALSLPSVTPMNAKLARVWMDDTYAALGNTEITGLRRFDIEILMGHQPSMDGADDIYLQGFDEGSLATMATFLFKRGTLTDGLFDDFVAKQTKFLKFFIDGPQIGAGVNHSLLINIGGAVTATPFDQFDRNLTFDTVVIEGFYDLTGAKQLDWEAITNVSAI